MIDIFLLIVIINENVDFVMELSMKLKDDPFVVVIVFWYHRFSEKYTKKDVFRVHSRQNK